MSYSSQTNILFLSFPNPPCISCVLWKHTNYSPSSSWILTIIKELSALQAYKYSNTSCPVSEFCAFSLWWFPITPKEAAFLHQLNKINVTPDLYQINQKKPVNQHKRNSSGIDPWYLLYFAPFVDKGLTSVRKQARANQFSEIASSPMLCRVTMRRNIIINVMPGNIILNNVLLGNYAG